MEDAGVLGYGGQGAAGGAEGSAVGCVRVGGADYVGAGGVDFGVNCEGGWERGEGEFSLAGLGCGGEGRGMEWNGEWMDLP